MKKVSSTQSEKETLSKYRKHFENCEVFKSLVDFELHLINRTWKRNVDLSLKKVPAFFVLEQTKKAKTRRMLASQTQLMMKIQI